jgi:hypothetical protein
MFFRFQYSFIHSFIYLWEGIAAQQPSSPPIPLGAPLDNIISLEKAVSWV